MSRLAILAAFLMVAARLSAQVTGEPGPARTPAPESSPADSLFVFEPAEPLIDTLKRPMDRRDVFGGDFLFSNSGFGLGIFYQRNFSSTFSGFINLGFTGSRTKDEFPQWNYESNSPEVPNKVNRLYTMPFVVGLRYRLFEGELSEEFRPYINAGLGPSMVIALPYEYEFFTSIGHASAYFTAGTFVGFGAEFGDGNTLMGLNLRYFYIPMEPGVESLRDDPISDFGGFFLTFNLGFQ